MASKLRTTSISWITTEHMKGYTSLPDYVFVGQYPKTPFRDLFTAASTEAISLLAKLLAYEPRRRISAKEVRVMYVYHAHPCSPLIRPFIMRISSSLRILRTIRSYPSQNLWSKTTPFRRSLRKISWTASKAALVPGKESPLEYTTVRQGHQH
jgi:serine/threonine protein kinase